MKWLDNLTGGYSSSAKVTNDTLIFSLPDAQSPIVWRMELSDIKAAAFEIQNKDDGNHMLVMKTSKKDPQEIATFNNNAKALKALMSVSQAMEQAYNAKSTIANDDINGGIATANTAPPAKKSGAITAGIIGILILALLIFGLTQIGPQTIGPGTSSSNSVANSESENGTKTVGVPVSADAFLKNR